jgi:hypothetical protein
MVNPPQNKKSPPDKSGRPLETQRCADGRMQ